MKYGMKTNGQNGGIIKYVYVIKVLKCKVCGVDWESEMW
jgi:hypothetical protein